jgi:hypothetical protein
LEDPGKAVKGMIGVEGREEREERETEGDKAEIQGERSGV